MKLADVAVYVEGELDGNPDIDIVGVSSLAEAQQGEITFITHKRYLPELARTKASALIASYDFPTTLPSIRVKNPSLAFARLLALFHPKPEISGGVDERAALGKEVKIGAGVTIFPFAYIGDRVEIGHHVVIYPGVFIGHDSSIGDETTLYPNVTIYDHVSIGRRVVIHSGSVIGSDGFGFVQDEKGRHHKIPQIGEVVIEDDVEIGSNVSIDRASLQKTIIGRGSKLDNLVHVGHNTIVGEDALLLAQVGLSGSCRVGNHVILGGQVGVIDHITIGDHVAVMGQSGIVKDIPPRSTMSWTPAMPHTLWRRVQALLPKLPEFVRTIHQLAQRVEVIEKKMSQREGST